MTAMEEQRLISEHDELVERQSRRWPHVRHEHGHAVYPVTDFINFGLHRLILSWCSIA